MAGPWEKYQQGDDGPWAKYATPSEPLAGSPSNPRRYTNPNRNKSDGELAWAGAKKFVGDIGLGARQFVDRTLGALGNPAAQENLAKLENIAENRKMDPTLRTGAGQAGYMGAAIIPAVGAAFIPGANTYAGGALIGGAMGAMQPTGEGDSWAANTAIGAGAGLAGQAAVNAVGRIAQPVRSGLNKAEARAVQYLKGKGVSLSVGQQTGSRAAQSVERTLADNPASAGAMARQGEKFRDSFTRAALKTVGENADGATPEVLGRAATRIGQVFDDVSSRYSLDVTNTQTANLLNALERRAGQELLNDPRIATQIANIRAAAMQNGGKLDGVAYKNLKTTLDNLSKQQNVGPYAAELREILDDALQTATRGTDDYARLVQARSQYRNLQAIADVADTTANGRVPPATLAQRLKSNKYTKNSMRFGRGDVELAKLARAGSTVTDRFPNSGTPARIGQQLMLPAALGGIGYGTSGDMDTAAKIAAATYLIPKAGGALMTNPAVQGYLSSGIGQGLTRSALLAPSRAGLGSMVPAYLLSQQ